MSFQKSKIKLDLYESFKFLNEQAQQPQQPQPQPNVANTNPMQPLPGQGGSQVQAVGSSGGQPMTASGEPINIDVVIDRFNIIRGGKSFSDPEVYGQLTTLFNAMSEPEKVSIEGFLTKTGEITTGPEQPVAQGSNQRTVQGPPPAAPPSGNQQPAAPAQAPAAPTGQV